LGSRRHPPRFLSSKGPNYQRGVLLTSAGAIEGYFEGKTQRESHKGVLFLHDSAPSHRALAARKKLAYLDLQWLDNPPYSPDLAPSNYHLFPELKKQLKGCHSSSDTEVIAVAVTWLDGKPADFFSGLQKFEQRAKKCIELRVECFEYIPSLVALVSFLVGLRTYQHPLVWSFQLQLVASFICIHEVFL
jgi:histone-lysine N-methyltransferase SETMAR